MARAAQRRRESRNSYLVRQFGQAPDLFNEKLEKRISSWLGSKLDLEYILDQLRQLAQELTKTYPAIASSREENAQEDLNASFIALAERVQEQRTREAEQKERRKINKLIISLKENASQSKDHELAAQIAKLYGYRCLYKLNNCKYVEIYGKLNGCKSWI